MIKWISILTLACQCVAQPSIPKRLVVVAPARYYTNKLAWDYSAADWLTVSNFVLMRGSATNFMVGSLVGKVTNVIVTRTGVEYFQVLAKGTNGLLSEPSNTLRVPPEPVIVINVTGINGATGLLSSASIKGPWSSLGTTNYWATNPSSPRYFRAKGKSGNRTAITRYLR